MKALLVTILLSSSFVSFSQISDEGLVGYWPFHGNTNDESGNGNHGIPHGVALESDRNGNLVSAIKLDGINDYIDVPDITSSNFQSFSFWIYPNSLGTGLGNVIINLGSTSSSESLYHSSTGSIGFKEGVYSNVHELHFPYVLGVDEWTHVVIVRANLNVKFYADGALLSEGVFNAGAPIQKVVSFGQANTGRGYFNGLLDDIRIYNRAISDAEVQALYSGENSGSVEVCENIFCSNDGVGIGTQNTHGYKLAVAGNILTEEIKVATQANWPDYVFEEGYPLTELDELEEYIRNNNHLPEIQSAQAIKETGYHLGEMDAKLLKKVEELTLYIIKQNKIIESQKIRMESQDQKMKIFEERLKELEKK